MADPLVSAFEALGVSDPEGWAESEKDEGIDQIGRATVLRAISDVIGRAPGSLADARDRWTPEAMAALERLGRSDDLDLVAKVVAYQTAWDIVALLDGAAVPEVNPQAIEFGVHRLDGEGSPTTPIDGLHESLQEVVAIHVGADVVDL